jgi:hypothetical protein
MVDNQEKYYPGFSDYIISGRYCRTGLQRQAGVLKPKSCIIWVKNCRSCQILRRCVHEYHEFIRNHYGTFSVDHDANRFIASCFSFGINVPGDSAVHAS